MKNGKKIAFLVYGESNSGRNALTEEKYRDLATAFYDKGFEASSVLYHDNVREKLLEELKGYDAVLVWVNPIEQGDNRSKLDSLLTELSANNCFVSAHPELILKMGTKDVLYKTRDMDWGSYINMYVNFEDFITRFPDVLKLSGVRVLKQYRGNGGEGVFKIMLGPGNEIKVVHAKRGAMESTYSPEDFYDEFRPFFEGDGLLIDQPWNENMVNGMVRCYLSGNIVAGFGYQEINALYELDGNAVEPSKRYYFTENCGLFRDLRVVMEKHWVPELQKKLAIETERLPVIWDADFFINIANSSTPKGKYTLCEINVSCVSPFPPSAVKFIVENVSNRL